MEQGKSKQLFDLMMDKGYPWEFIVLITSELSTDFTAGRMIGYILGCGRPSMEDVSDEMLAILSDRDRIRDKHLAEHAQSRINEMYYLGSLKDNI
jgi:hypothetical protein